MALLYVLKKYDEGYVNENKIVSAISHVNNFKIRWHKSKIKKLIERRII